MSVVSSGVEVSLHCELDGQRLNVSTTAGACSVPEIMLLSLSPNESCLSAAHEVKHCGSPHIAVNAAGSQESGLRTNI